jgi:putative PIN family toxin of toxin-antitoxin system
MTIRVVLDSNVVVSALLFERGSLWWLRAEWLAGHCRPLVSADTVEELLRVLCYPKFQLTVEDREELLGDYLPFTETVNVPASSNVPRCSDPDDQKFLALAFAGQAKLLVTGDRELLELDSRCPFKIISPARARALIGE